MRCEKAKEAKKRRTTAIDPLCVTRPTVASGRLERIGLPLATPHSQSVLSLRVSLKVIGKGLADREGRSEVTVRLSELI